MTFFLWIFYFDKIIYHKKFYIRIFKSNIIIFIKIFIFRIRLNILLLSEHSYDSRIVFYNCKLLNFKNEILMSFTRQYNLLQFFNDLIIVSFKQFVIEYFTILIVEFSYKLILVHIYSSSDSSNDLEVSSTEIGPSIGFGISPKSDS